jgi:KR domain
VGSGEEAAAAARLAAGAAPCVGLVHAAGTLADAALGAQTPALVRRVFAPKAAAERALSQVTPSNESMHAVSCIPVSARSASPGK